MCRATGRRAVTRVMPGPADSSREFTRSAGDPP
ncbi:hypothetical protein Ae263Ps1_5596c [Pseudonocardia sp. Ae263_Ps1]|nr:hypothetical protein Ae263Ps1_5596c [Pseudonocardia sp. Ae263_Ps1]